MFSGKSRVIYPGPPQGHGTPFMVRLPILFPYHFGILDWEWWGDHFLHRKKPRLGRWWNSRLQLSSLASFTRRGPVVRDVTGVRWSDRDTPSKAQLGNLGGRYCWKWFFLNEGWMYTVLYNYSTFDFIDESFKFSFSLRPSPTANLIHFHRSLDVLGE